MTAHSVGSNSSSAGGDANSVSVKVAVRSRPLNDLELSQRSGGIEVINLDLHRNNVTVVPEARSFAYDYVFGPDSEQTEIYEDLVTPLLEKFLEGYNATVLAYGQTSSGKTYTMGTGSMGIIEDEDVGIIPRAVQDLFDRIHHTQQIRPNVRIQVRVSFLEIYNEELIDLLVDAGSRPNIQIREDPRGNIYWTGVREALVSSPEDVMGLLELGSQHRQVGQTDMNAKSSRSHAIFSVTVKQDKNSGEGGRQLAVPSRSDTPNGIPSRIGRRASSPLGPHRRAGHDDGGAGDGEWTVVTSKFHFVDLAGSERLKRTNAVGNRAKEGININAGLSALGNVISALGDTSKRSTHIPYRDSKLTRLLQDSLGGNSQTLMIACISPAPSNLSETLNTLKYANRARNIKNIASKNEEMSNDVNYLQQQVVKLRNEVKLLREGNGSSLSSDGYDDSRSGSRMASPNRLNRPVTPNGSNTPQSAPASPGMHGQPFSGATDNIPQAFIRRLQKSEAELARVNRSYRHLLAKYEDASAELSELRDEHSRALGTIANGAQGGGSNSGGGGDIDAFARLNNKAFVAEVEPVIEEYEKVVTQLEGKVRQAQDERDRFETELRSLKGQLRFSEQVQRRNAEEIARLRERLRTLDPSGLEEDTEVMATSASRANTTRSNSRATPGSSISSFGGLARSDSRSTNASSIAGGLHDSGDLNELHATINELKQHFEDNMGPSASAADIVLDGCPNLNALSRLLENGLHTQ